MNRVPENIPTSEESSGQGKAHRVNILKAIGKTLAGPAVAVAVFGGLAAFTSGRQKSLSFAGRVAQEYHYDKLDTATQDSFSRLVYLSPDTIDTVTWSQSPQLEAEFGKAIQLDLSQVSRKLFAMDAELPDRPVDEYDLAQALIPQAAQAEMRQEGISFTPIAPINCDLDYNYDPLDYSGSAPNDFAVTLSSPGTYGQSMTIPLGAAQSTTVQDPVNIFSTTYDFMDGNPAIETLPCWAFPQTLPPNDLKQVY